MGAVSKGAGGCASLSGMNSLRVVWRNTTMVVLTALSAALYAAILLPFKILPIIPGVTEVRPANAIPIVCSLWFGPAGAWGSAIGNTVGDFIGLGFGIGTIFGFIGNFFYGFVPFAFWRAMFGSEPPRSDNRLHWAGLIFACLVASAACAFSIGWGIEFVIGGVPFAILATIIFFNNFLMAVLLGPPLLFALLPRIGKWGLLYTQILPSADTVRPRMAWLGVILMTLGSIGGLATGVAVETGLYKQTIGVPSLLKGIRKAAMPVLVKEPVPVPAELAPARPAAETAARPGKGATPTAAGAVKKTEHSTATPALAKEPPSAVRTPLALGLTPFLALMFLGMLLL